MRSTAGSRRAEVVLADLGQVVEADVARVGTHRRDDLGYRGQGWYHGRYYKVDVLPPWQRSGTCRTPPRNAQPRSCLRLVGSVGLRDRISWQHPFMEPVDWGIGSSPARFPGVSGDCSAPVDSDDPWVMPVVRAASRQGYEPAPEAPRWTFLPAVWPTSARAWILDTRIRHARISCDGQPAQVVPWCTADYFEVEADANELPPSWSTSNRRCTSCSGNLAHRSGQLRGSQRPRAAGPLDRNARRPPRWLRVVDGHS